MDTAKQSSWRTLGAVAPSTSYLANAMTRYVCSPSVLRILEVGAGTGAITKALVENMHERQWADVVEIFPSLYKMLDSRFAHIPNIAIHCQDILHCNFDMPYDLIISSLPFNSFLPHILNKVIFKLIELAKPGAHLCFYEYRILQRLMPDFLIPKQKLKQFYHSRLIIEEFIRQYKFDEMKVRLNTPPAMVHYLRINKP